MIAARLRSIKIAKGTLINYNTYMQYMYTFEYNIVYVSLSFSKHYLGSI